MKNGSPFNGAESSLGRKRRFNEEHFIRYGNIPAKLEKPFPLIPRDASIAEDLHPNSYPRSKRFRLWIDEESAEYHRIMERIGKGYSLLRYERTKFVPEQQHWVILLSWIDMFLEEAQNAPILDKNEKPHQGYETTLYE